MEKKETPIQKEKKLCTKCGKEESFYSKWINGKVFYGTKCEPCQWNAKWFGEFPYSK
jgi:hypothetical protein